MVGYFKLPHIALVNIERSEHPAVSHKTKHKTRISIRLTGQNIHICQRRWLIYRGITLLLIDKFCSIYNIDNTHDALDISLWIDNCHMPSEMLWFGNIAFYILWLRMGKQIYKPCDTVSTIELE